MNDATVARPSPSRPYPRVAIACSGLGHVHRGVESWAVDLATALRSAGVTVGLYGGSMYPSTIAIPCLHRSSVGARLLTRACRYVGGWHYGAGSPYEIEQTSFSLGLWRQIRADYDVLHVQDPLLAYILACAKRHGMSRPQVVYANGTGEQARVMRQFEHLQLLTPESAAEWNRQRPPGQSVYIIPNFIDTQRFTPGNRCTARTALGLPHGSLIFLCCAAISRRHKRVDYLVQEFAAASQTLDHNVMLVVAGAQEDETDELITEATTLLGNSVRFLVDFPRERMVELYQAADIFVLTSMFEMFGIVLVEAMACGLPVICNDSASFRYVVGPAGIYRDLSRRRALTAVICEMARIGAYQVQAEAARPQVEAHFSEQVVVQQVISMYNSVLSGGARAVRQLGSIPD